MPQTHSLARNHLNVVPRGVEHPGSADVPLMDRIVLNIPHASLTFPFGTCGWEDGIQREVTRWTDWYTDWLFSSVSRIDARIIHVTYPFSRFFCDAERLEEDPLEAVGKGIVYRRFGALERTLSEQDLELAMESYREHRDRLRAALSPGGSLLVDCHSFPSDLSSVDVCIGVNDGWSRPEEELLSRTAEHFTSCGYRTAINEPYSNSISPETGFVYWSVMIEINKRCYMNADVELDIKKAPAMRRCIESWLLSLLSGS